MIQRGSGEESLTALRSPVLTGAGACGSVLVLEDGIPIRPVGTCNVNELFEVNLEQAAAIEVLRGTGERALRLERRARHHQRDPADAGRRSPRSAPRSNTGATRTSGCSSAPRATRRTAGSDSS
jgi:hypothetical protein